MKIFIVVDDLGDGDVALRYFEDEDKANQYIVANPEWCYHESNPFTLDTTAIEFEENVK